MKKIFKVVIFATCLAMLSGCQVQEESTETTDDQDVVQEDTQDGVQVEPQDEDFVEVVSEDYLFFGGSEDDANLLACGLVGYPELSEEALEASAADYAEGRLVSDYDTLFMGGSELYLVVPKYEGTIITVNEVDTSGGENIVGDVVLSTDKPLFIMCNPSDLRSNVEIMITYLDMEITFSPYVSLEDGRLVLPDQSLIIANEVDE